MIFDFLVFVVGFSAGFWLAFWLLREKMTERDEAVLGVIKAEVQRLERPRTDKQEKMDAIRAHIAARKAKQGKVE